VAAVVDVCKALANLVNWGWDEADTQATWHALQPLTITAGNYMATATLPFYDPIEDSVEHGSFCKGLNVGRAATAAPSIFTPVCRSGICGEGEKVT
jgi:hypothetical protein